MKFLADMGISPLSVAFLRSLGHEAAHLHAQGLDRLPDSAILEKARNEGAVLLTGDLDFGALLAASGESLPSVVIFRLQDMRPENIHRHLREVPDRHMEDLERGAILSVSERAIRVRRLPV